MVGGCNELDDIGYGLRVIVYIVFRLVIQASIVACSDIMVCSAFDEIKLFCFK